MFVSSRYFLSKYYDYTMSKMPDERVIRDIPYGILTRHRLDIYRPDIYRPEVTSLPSSVNQPVPVVLHVHGGGWQRGSKDENLRGGPSAGKAYSSTNCVTVVISYRLAPPSFSDTLLRGLIDSFVLSLLFYPWLKNMTFATFFLKYMLPFIMSITFIYTLAVNYISSFEYVRHPHQIQDISNALSWVYDNIGRLCPETLTKGQTRPKGIFLSGHSSGAHLISLLICDLQYLKIPRTFIRGIILISGVYSLSGPYETSLFNLLFRMTYSSSAIGEPYHIEELEKASPIHYVHSDLPPFLILNASTDYPGLKNDANRFISKLNEKGILYEYYVIKNTNHITITYLDENEALPLVSTFIQKYHL